MEVNTDKARYFNQPPPGQTSSRTNIGINGEHVGEVDYFPYLGSVFSKTSDVCRGHWKLHKSCTLCVRAPKPSRLQQSCDIHPHQNHGFPGSRFFYLSLCLWNLDLVPSWHQTPWEIPTEKVKATAQHSVGAATFKQWNPQACSVA